MFDTIFYVVAGVPISQYLGMSYQSIALDRLLWEFIVEPDSRWWITLLWVKKLTHLGNWPTAFMYTNKDDDSDTCLMLHSVIRFGLL